MFGEWWGLRGECASKELLSYLMGSEGVDELVDVGENEPKVLFLFPVPHSVKGGRGELLHIYHLFASHKEGK